MALRHRCVTAAGLRWHLVEDGGERRPSEDGEDGEEGGVGGAPPIVLLAGFPQSWYAWRRVMPMLAAAGHRVVAVDLPGQGDSDKPDGGYDARTTGDRLSALLDTLGLDRVALVGHDIGAWMAYPFAARHPEAVTHLALLDANIPGVTLAERFELGPDNWKRWHFLFNTVPDLPEALLKDRERVLIEWFFARKTANAPAVFDRADIDEYERVYRQPGGLRGMLGYYRAAIADAAANRALADTPMRMPVLALGGDVGSAPDLFDAMRGRAERLQGGVLSDCGHYLPEEQPDVVTEHLLRLLAMS
ncbi:alpha/beta fold hydrolase [Roseateles chitinivorans]|uniref:alpha/beta fold hydrolase n=1 Tax=Roseateles chitinivorans TaxID=2917965 RepID=UPI003D664D26